MYKRQPYTGAHVVTQLQLLLFSGLAFFVMLNYLKRTPTITLAFDWIWRVFCPAIVRVSRLFWRDGCARAANTLSAASLAIVALIVRHQRPDGMLVRSWPTGSMALWVMVMLLAYLFFYYLGR